MAPSDAVAAAGDIINGSLANRQDLVASRLTRPTLYMTYPAWQAALRQVMSRYDAERGIVVGWSAQVSFGAAPPWQKQASLTMRYPGYAGAALEARFDLVQRMGRYRVVAMELEELTAANAKMNDFDPAGSGFGRAKSPSQTLMLFVPLALLCFLLVSTVSCLLTRDLAYKPAWLAAIWVGAFEVTLNWTTGQFTVVPFAIALPPVWLSQLNDWQPMIVEFLIPVGAIYYWVERARRTPLPVCKIPEKDA